MKKSNSFSPKVHEHMVRMAFQKVGEYPSQWATMLSMASKICCSPETFRKCFRSRNRHRCKWRLSSEDRAWIMELERENR